MGQKVNPIGLRLGVNRTWDSRWFARGAEYANLLHQDLKLRTWLKERLNAAGVSRIIIERPHKKCRVTIYAARPGVVIGKKGADIEKLRKDISARTDGEVHLNIVEVRKPETDAQLIAENIAQQLERRIAFRRAMKKAVATAMKFGSKGIRVRCAGRLGGSEMSRVETYREGRVPLHTLRADIDYGSVSAKTTSGRIGVKVWIYKGDIVPYKASQDDKIAKEAAMAVGETAGKATDAPKAPRVVTSGGAKRRKDVSEEVEVEKIAQLDVDAPAKDLVGEADPELEKLLQEEEDIEKRTSKGGHETPHFRGGED